MSFLRLTISTIAIIASTKASGFGHISAVKSFPVVRYAPFYNFPNTVRSIHAVAPAAPVFAPAPAPLFPAPLAPAPFPHSGFPAPTFAAPALPSPAIAPATVPAPFFPGPLSSPVFSVPAFTPALPALAPALPVLPKLAPTYPILPRITPIVPSVPFSPIIKPVASAPIYPAPAPIYPAPAPIFPAPAPVFAPAAPVIAPAPVAFPRVVPVQNHLHLYNRFIPAPVEHSSIFKQAAWK